MSQLSPKDVITEVAAAIPEEIRKHVVIIGSLAAGYSFFAHDSTKAVRTKDVDCILEPFEAAVSTAEELTQLLLDKGWQRRLVGERVEPGTSETPVDQLPVVRLYPPNVDMNSDAWFLELLTVPQSEHQKGRTMTRISLLEGDYVLPSFRFLSIVAYSAENITALGIRCAQPQLMALANLLENPVISTATTGGTSLKRSNKDLGRVLAIAQLTGFDDFSPWMATWLPALKHCFPTQWATLAPGLGGGLRELLNSQEDFEQAYVSCVNGLLSSVPTTVTQLRSTANRLLGDVIEPLEQIARNSSEANA